MYVKIPYKIVLPYTVQMNLQALTVKNKELKKFAKKKQPTPEAKHFCFFLATDQKILSLQILASADDEIALLCFITEGPQT